MKRVLAVALLLAFGLAGSARAADEFVVDPLMTNVVPATFVYGDQLIREALVVADIRNARAGHSASCAPIVDIYDEPTADSIAARGETPGCHVYFTRTFRDDTWREVNDAHEPLIDRRQALTDLCTVAIHERLHNQGLLHAATGIMTPSPTVTPGACTRWARTKLPQYKSSRR